MAEKVEEGVDTTAPPRLPPHKRSDEEDTYY